MTKIRKIVSQFHKSNFSLAKAMGRGARNTLLDSAENIGMNEYRCRECHKLLYKTRLKDGGSYGNNIEIEIVCPKCSKVNVKIY